MYFNEVKELLENGGFYRRPWSSKRNYAISGPTVPCRAVYDMAESPPKFVGYSVMGEEDILAGDWEVVQ